MDLTPEALRSARFREKLRGYHPDDVDAFLESVAEGLEVLLRRLREAAERVRRVETGAMASDAEESVRRTLVLAQRTADLAIAEARETAAKLMADAETRSAEITGNAQDAALATAERAQEQLRIDLDRLQGARDQLSSDVRALEQWLEGERSRLKGALSELADRVEAVRGDEPAPQTHSVDTPSRPSRPEVATPSPPRPAATAFAPVAAPESVPSRPTRPLALEPSPAPVPEPAPPPWVAPEGDDDLGEPENSDGAVLMRAQTPSPAASNDAGAEDPYFAELRRAISDPQPLGPRDDDDEDAFEGSVGDIFDSRRTSRLRRRR